MSSLRQRTWGKTIALMLAMLISVSGLAYSQDAESKPTAPAGGAAPGVSAADELLQRLRKMEEANQKLARKVEEIADQNQRFLKEKEDLSRQNQHLSRQFNDLSEKLKTLEGAQTRSDEAAAEQVRVNEEPVFEAAGTRSGDAESLGADRVGTSDIALEGQIIGNRRLGKAPVKVRYNYEREGIQFMTSDDEFELKVRAMFQGDGRLYTRQNQNPVSSGFYVPRARFYFTGRLSKPIEYNFSFQRDYDSTDVMNAYINLHYDDRFQFRFGRFKTPFTYEYYKLHVWQLMAPERSLFNMNFQGGRQVGAMALGDLFGRHLEYAVGVFDGPRRSLNDYNSAKDVMTLINAIPFQHLDDSPLRNLNLGGSLDFGDENNPLTPAVLRTSANANSIPLSADEPLNNAALPFLAFNQNVREKGFRALWEAHLAYYYKGLSVLAAWNGGYSDYAINGAGHRPVHVPIGGYTAQAAYLLTGETITNRVLVDPIRPFDLRKGRFGLGAWEVTARYSTLTLGNQVFSAGLADPSLWTDRVGMVDVGVNWYLNKWVKVYFDWERAMFAQPVYYAPGPERQNASDMFWMRFQLYF